MTQEGNKFSYTFPAFADGDVVDYVVFATSSEDITGEYRGTFLVANVIESIAAIQQTADDAIANSPLAGLGVLNLNITATVVADANDGLVVVHEAAAPWSGIYLDARIPAVKELVRGDVVKITAAEVIEDRDGTGVTYLTKVELSKTGEDSDYANLIPSVTTDEVRATPEAYEGMVLTFEGVEVFNLQADELQISVSLKLQLLLLKQKQDYVLMDLTQVLLLHSVLVHVTLVTLTMRMLN